MVLADNEKVAETNWESEPCVFMEVSGKNGQTKFKFGDELWQKHIIGLPELYSSHRSHNYKIYLKCLE